MADKFISPAFPAGFTWGAATASYQIEGSPTADGKGESIWDRFCTVPGAIVNGDTGDVACDHYRRWQDDVALMRELGLDAYRFSISWPRVLPEGRGRVNSAGLDFYDRLTDGLLEAGITPYVTLYHWDLPQALQDRGGWVNRDIASWFAAYTEAVAARLGDRVKQWITINEPAVVAFLGYQHGEHAPGIRDMRAAYATAHNLLRAHGKSIQALRASVSDCRAGITLNLYPAYRAGDRREDEEAALIYDGVQNRWFLDPLYRGSYPGDISQMLGAAMPEVESSDWADIGQPTDFLGVNYYTRSVVRKGRENAPFGFDAVEQPQHEHTDMGWEVYPDGLRSLLERLHQDYPVQALYITENGAAFPDVVSPDGAVHDTRRQAYLEEHFAAMLEAIDHGAPVRGYFVWSLMDNFEWAWGYGKRFGIVHVDYETQRRTLKDSARWYQQFLAARTSPGGNPG